MPLPALTVLAPAAAIAKIVVRAIAARAARAAFRAVRSGVARSLKSVRFPVKFSKRKIIASVAGRRVAMIRATNKELGVGLRRAIFRLYAAHPLLTGRSGASWMLIKRRGQSLESSHGPSLISNEAVGWGGYPPPHLTPSKIKDRINPDYPSFSAKVAQLTSASRVRLTKKNTFVSRQFYNPLNYLYHLNAGTHRFAGTKYKGFVDRAIIGAFNIREIRAHIARAGKG